MAWPNLTELKQDQDVDLTDNRDDAVLSDHLDAAIEFVKRVRPDLTNASEIPADVKLGTLRLAARWFARRKSPSALVEMGELGSARVPSFDPDIERLLRIGRYKFPVIA